MHKVEIKTSLLLTLLGAGSTGIIFFIPVPGLLSKALLMFSFALTVSAIFIHSAQLYGLFRATGYRKKYAWLLVSIPFLFLQVMLAYGLLSLLPFTV